MVRLKERPTRAYSVLNLFQFHYGTIYFNSTMVRLKDRIYAAAMEEYGYFNSTMVRLKDQH